MTRKWIIAFSLILVALGVIFWRPITSHVTILLVSPENRVKLADGYRSGGDFSRAFLYYKSAAKSELPEAMFYVGRAYENGEGVSKDIGKAFDYYLDASNRGLPEAQVNLGMLYKQRAKEGDIEKAIQWTRSAAKAGDVNAYSNLAKWYLEGKIVQKDIQESLKWRNLAAEAGDGIACYRLALHYLDGNGVDKNAEMAEDYFKKALVILSKDENCGELSAILTLANMYRKGYGVLADQEKALEYYYVANLLADGIGVSIKQDVVVALEHGMDSRQITEIKNRAEYKFKHGGIKSLTLRNGDSG